jgi:CBS domain-containing protein
VEPDEPVVAAVDIMVDTRLRSLPVVERGRGRPVLVGIVSRTDVLKCLVVDECGPA